MIKEIPDGWTEAPIPRNERESVWIQWLLFNNVTYVITFGKVYIKDPEVALMFRLTFGV